ncbi:hypothetical protein ABE073_18760 [Lederbergia citrisecunda]
MAISIRLRQLIGTRTQIKLRSSVLLATVPVALTALVVLAVSLTVLISSVALIVSSVLIVSAALIVFVVVAVAAANISRNLTNTTITKVPAVVAGAFLYKGKHMEQVTVHRIVVYVIISI